MRATGLHREADIGTRQIDAAIGDHRSLDGEVVQRLSRQDHDVGRLPVAQAVEQRQRPVQSRHRYTRRTPPDRCRQGCERPPSGPGSRIPERHFSIGSLSRTRLARFATPGNELRGHRLRSPRQPCGRVARPIGKKRPAWRGANPSPAGQEHAAGGSANTARWRNTRGEKEHRRHGLDRGPGRNRCVRRQPPWRSEPMRSSSGSGKRSRRGPLGSSGDDLPDSPCSRYWRRSAARGSKRLGPQCRS